MKNFKRTMAKVLCISFSASMLFVPYSQAADGDYIFADISDYFNEDLFVMEGNATRTNTYADLLYNGEKIPNNKEISIGDYTFEIQGDLSHDNNDVINIAEEISISLNDEIVKNIAVIANGVSEGGQINAKILYSDGSEEEVTAEISAMTQEGALSYDMGLNLYKTDDRLRPTFTEGETELYLNAAVFNVAKAVKAASIILMPADFEYHVVAVTANMYNSDELEDMMRQEIEETLPLYQNKDIFDLTDDDTAPLESLYKALQTGKDLGFELATDENIEYIGNLYNGYILYKELKIAGDDIEEIMAVKDYTTVTAEELTDDDIVNLERLLEIYNTVDPGKLDQLSEIWEYFALDEELYPNVDLSDKQKIEELGNEYQYYKEKTELENKIKEYEDLYLKSMDLIEESDLEKLQELLALYDEAADYDIQINENNREKAETIINGYDSYLTSEDHINVDISPYVNSDNILLAGDTYDPATLGGGVFSAYLYGTNLQTSEGVITGNEVYASSEDTWEQTGNTLTYKLVENGWNGMVNDSITMSQACPEVRIPMSGRLLQEIDIAMYTVETTITPTVVYDDGTSEELKGTSTKAYASAYYDNSKQTRAYITKDSDGNFVYGESGQNGFLGVVGSRTLIMNESGELVDNGSNQTLGFVSFAYKIPQHKAVKELVLTGASNSKYGVVAINEVPLKNADLRAALEQAWKKINPDNITTGDRETIQSIVRYVNEGKLRGIIFDDIVDMDVVANLEEMVLTVATSFARLDKNTVKAELNFSVPVSKIDGMISVKKGESAVEFSANLNEDKTKAEILINCTEKGGDTYTFTLSRDTAILKYPSMTLGNDMVYSYTAPAYFDAVFADNILTVTNNSLTDQNIVLYITKTNAEKTLVNETAVSEKVLGANSQTTLSLYVADAPGYETFVWDDNMKVLAEAEPIKTTPEEIISNADYKEVNVDLDNNSVVIAGKTPSGQSDKYVTVRLTAKGENYYIGNIKTNQTGNFSFNILLENVTDSDYIDVYLGGDDFQKPENFKFYFSSEDDRIELINNIKNADSSADIAPYLEQAKDILALDFVPYNSIDMSKFAERIFAIRNTLDSSELTKTQNILKVQSILEAFEEGISEAVAENGNLKYDEYINYSSLNDTSTLWTIYQEDLSDEGKKFIVSSLLGNDFEDTSDLTDMAAEKIFLAGIKYPKTSGTGYISRVLTQKNAQTASLTSSQISTVRKYENASNKTKYNDAIVKANIEAIDDIIDCIDNVPESSGGGGNGGSGGTSGSGSSSSGLTPSGNSNAYYMGGVDVTPAKDNENVSDNIFSDVDEDFWAYEAIKDLYEKGIISGKGNKIFAPSDNVTRAEFVKILCEAMDVEIQEGTSGFNDVTDDKWYAKYVFTAYNNGWVTGISETEFGADLPISRQDLCTILFRMNGSEAKNSSSFADSNEIADYAIDAVAFFSENGVISGFEDNTFRPESLCSRAQAATIIYRYLNNF